MCGALALALAAVACQPSQPDAPSNAALAPLPAPVDGFRADAWFLPDEAQLGFVDIPAGPFLMGSDPAVDPQAFDNERWSPENTQGTVDLPAFAIGRYEVTVAQFHAFAADAGVTVDAAALGGAPDHPVGSISWPDALHYCRWLEATLRTWTRTPASLRQRLDDGWRMTLPSEAQWEKAARGADGRIYPWGDEPPRGRATFGPAGPGAVARSAGPTPVGSFDCSECPFGLRDMSGNVWELTRSPYRPYPLRRGGRGRGPRDRRPLRHARRLLRGPGRQRAGGHPRRRRPGCAPTFHRVPRRDDATVTNPPR